MKIGILITSIGNFGGKGFYNAQEIGLAKALTEYFESVELYKLVSKDTPNIIEKVENYANIKIFLFSTKNYGINGVLDVSILSKELNAIIHFSDTQFSTPSAYAWCKKNGIQYIPYIGVVESHSTSKVKQFVTNLMFKRNVAVYRRCTCCAKTPAVQIELKNHDIKKTILAPVGLDLDLLNKRYAQYDSLELRREYGYKQSDKILLFIGRLTEEKQPIRMVEIFLEILAEDKSYKLLIVGKGELKDKVIEKIKEFGVEDSVQMVDCILNRDIWKLYCLSDVFVNLNQQEIFGMAILEAMYYECKVVAWKAPGPDFILTEETGYLAKSNQEILEYILNGEDTGKASHKRIVDEFTWNSTAKKIAMLTGEKHG